MHGNGTLGVIEFPDPHEDGTDTHAGILFGADLAVLSSDPALGAPSPAGNGSHTEIAGAVPATPGKEYRFEFSLLPTREGITAIDAAGFARGTDRLVLDVMPGTAQGGGARQPAAGPGPGDPPERAIPRGEMPASGAVPGEAAGAGHSAPADAPAANGTERGAVRGSPAGIAHGFGNGTAAARNYAGDGAPGTAGGDLFLYGHIWPPYTSRVPARDLTVCVHGGDDPHTPARRADGTAACTLTNEHGLYALGPFNVTELNGTGTGPYPALWIHSSGSGATVVGQSGHTYAVKYGGIRLDPAGGSARFDMSVHDSSGDRGMAGAANIISTIADARAFIEEFGVEIPHVRVYWEPGKRATEIWPPGAGGGGPAYNTNSPEMFLDGLHSPPTAHDASKSRYAIQREYARHVHNHLGAAPEGCAHNLTAGAPPGCALAGGFAHFVPHLVDGTPYLREHGDAYVDIERELFHVGRIAYPLFGHAGSAGGQTAMQVAGALWDVYDGPADHVHDRKRRVVEGRLVAEGGILDDVHAGAGGIISTMRDGPQSAEQFYAMWNAAGRESIANVMDLHGMQFGAPADPPALSPVAPVLMSHTEEATVAVSAAVQGGGGAALDVRQGFAGGHGYGRGGASVADGGDGAGTLLLRPARADVGENAVVVRANQSGRVDLARIDVTVTDPPKWAPVQLNSTFDRGLADWAPDDHGAWRAVATGDPSSPHLEFSGGNAQHVTLSHGIDLTAYESASISLRFGVPHPPETPSELRAWALEDGAERLLGAYDLGSAAPAGFREAAADLPDGLLRSSDLGLRLSVHQQAPSPGFRLLVDDVVLAGARGGNPAIEAPGNVTAEAASPGNTAVQLGEPRTDPAGLAVTHEPQGPFPLGTTAVTWTATNTATGESDSGTQHVTVRDTTPPAVTPPANYTVSTSADAVFLSAIDYCTASAEDAISDTILLGIVGERPDVIWPPRDYGSHFPAGETTTVTWIAMDSFGNAGTAEQGVTVVRSDAARNPARVTHVWADPAAPPGSGMLIRVAFTQPVALTAAAAGEDPGSIRPSMAMAGGGRAEYESGNGTRVLTFSYAVQPGEEAPDYAGTGALGGPCTIRGAADNRGARMSLPDPGQPGIAGPVAARVVRVFSDAEAGVYGDGDTIRVYVEFSWPVAVTGSPRLLLEAGAPGAAAEYVAGYWGKNILRFDYEVRAADAAADLDYAGTGALVLGGGSIDALGGGEAADLSLPEPAAEPGLLNGEGKIVVGTKPHVQVGVFARSTGHCGWQPDYALCNLGSGAGGSGGEPHACAEHGLCNLGDSYWAYQRGHACSDRGADHRVCSQAHLGVFEPGADNQSATAARLGAAAFNSLSAERGYPVFVDVTEYWLPQDAEAPWPYGALIAEEALRAAHAGGEGPVLYVGPASDRALHGMADYAAENGITLVSHSSAARSLAVEDGIYRLDPGTGHMARALAHTIAQGGFDAVVPVVQEDLYGSGIYPATYGLTGLCMRSLHAYGLCVWPVPEPSGALPAVEGYTFEYGLLESLALDLEPFGVRVEPAVEFGTARNAYGIAPPLESAVLAAGGAGTGRNVAVLYVGSDSALAKIAYGVGANSPIVSRSAWFAAGGAGAGTGTGVAASPAVAWDESALRLARWTGLAAVQPAAERDAATDEIDEAMWAGPAAATPAYAAYEAVRILGRALALAGGDPAAVGQHMHEAADTGGGPLGRMVLDEAGDLRLPITYGAWSVSPIFSPDWQQAPGGQIGANLTSEAAGTGWQSAPGALLRGIDTCEMVLEKSAIDLHSVSPGRISGPARQVVTNAGTAEMPAVSITASDWRLHRGGTDGGALPYSLTEMAVGGAGDQFAPLAPGASIPEGTPPAGRVDVDFRINLSGMESLEADSITQTVT